jgi:hypothetical protein
MTNFLDISDLIGGKEEGKIADQDVDFSNNMEEKKDDDDIERKKMLIIMLLKKGRES